MKLKDLSLREKVYQTIITHAIDLNSMETPEAFIEKYPVGGFYFSKGSMPDLVEANEGEASITQAFMKRCRAAAKYPLLVCADGANIDDDGLQVPDFDALGAADSEELAYECGKALGMQMNYNDIDWILAPAIDMPMFRCVDTVSAAMSDDPELTAKLYTQVVKGIQDQNVAATVKHFPGIGTHHVNMHIAPGHNVFEFDKWMETYGYTYKEMFKAGAMCTMTSHITLKSFSEKSDYGDEPIATFSKDLTIGLLKEKLGFDGVVVTDALTMGGCGLEDQVEQAVASFACGADLLLWPPLEAGDRIVEEIEKGNIPMERLDDALERIQLFRERLGMTDTDREKKAVDKKSVDDTFRKIIEDGITLIRNEKGNLPLASDRKKVFISVIAPDSKLLRIDDKMKAAELFADILNKNGFETKLEFNHVCFRQDWIDKEVPKYDYFIFILSTPFCVGQFRECFNSAWTVHQYPAAKKIVLNFSTPFFIDDYYPNEKTFVQVNSQLNEESVVAVADAILGKAPMTGKLAMKSVKI